MGYYELSWGDCTRLMSRLASLLRPQSLDMFVGQTHLVGEGRPLRRFLENGEIPHLFMFGPPGTGKTTLAKLIAHQLNLPFFSFNATDLKIEELRKVFASYRQGLVKPLIFIDEVHRLAKNQQEVLLPVMENHDAYIMGASTENPFFTLTAAIRSRSLLFELFVLSRSDLEILFERAVMISPVRFDDEARAYVIDSCGGDARAMLTLIEFASMLQEPITKEALMFLRPHALHDGSSSDETHYNLTSALIKSIRGSDPDAAIYYLARLIAGGESADFIARRLVISASEDIGNANPQALIIAQSAASAVMKIGFPEARIILAQAVIYLASSPKSNSALIAIDTALAMIAKGEILDVPDHLKDSHFAGAKSLGRGEGYLYPHDFGGYVKQRYLAKDLKIVSFKPIAYEAKLSEWLQKIHQTS